MRLPLLVLLACLAIVPAAIADSPPASGDQSPSYGGPGGGGGGGGAGGGGGSGDTSAPFVDLSTKAKHLAKLARTGKLKVTAVTSEACTVKLRGKISVGPKRISVVAKTIALKLGTRSFTVKLSAKQRKALRRALRAAGKGAKGKVTLTGSAADGAKNKRAVSLKLKLKR